MSKQILKNLNKQNKFRAIDYITNSTPFHSDDDILFFKSISDLVLLVSSFSGILSPYFRLLLQNRDPAIQF